MPNRIIREGILTSPKLAKLGWAEEVFYRRLLSVVDDFGRYYADAGMLRAACYPRQLNKVSDSDVGKWLSACAAAALVRVYPAEDGERYLEVVKFDQQVRAKKSKFPDMRSECLADATHTQANEHLDVVVSVVEDVCVIPRKRGKPTRVQIPEDFGVSERVRAWAAEKGHGRLDEHLESFKAKAAAHGYAYADWDAAFMEAIRNDWAKLPPLASSAVQSGKPKGPSETPLENAIAYARHRFATGAIDEAERDRLISDATAKYRRKA